MKKDGLLQAFGIVAAVCGVAMMVYGAFRGEVDVVLQKAVNICLECIGIG